DTHTERRCADLTLWRGRAGVEQRQRTRIVLVGSRAAIVADGAVLPGPEHPTSGCLHARLRPERALRQAAFSLVSRPLPALYLCRPRRGRGVGTWPGAGAPALRRSVRSRTTRRT